jgi:pyruvate,orthophosphate dikinase
MVGSTLSMFVYAFEEGSRSDISTFSIYLYLYTMISLHLPILETFGIYGANLCEMARWHLPVPSGFVVVLECTDSAIACDSPKQATWDDMHFREQISRLEQLTRKSFNPVDVDTSKLQPLLLSVSISTDLQSLKRTDLSVTNIGMNDLVVERLIALTCNPHWVFIQFLEFIVQYGVVVLGVDKQRYGDIINTKLQSCGVQVVSSLINSDLQDLINEMKGVNVIPVNPCEQLQGVIHSLYTAANKCLKTNRSGLSDKSADNKVAIVVQSVVHGDKTIHSGSGVVFSRHPSTGVKRLLGEYRPHFDSTTSFLLDQLTSTRTSAGSPSAQLRNSTVTSLDDLSKEYPSVCGDLEKYARPRHAGEEL